MKTKFATLTVLISFLSLSVLAQNNPENKTASHERIISINYNKVKGPFNTMFKECIGAGRANEGLRADWQQQLAYVKKECDFKYIRMHGLLTDDMGVYREDKNGNRNTIISTLMYYLITCKKTELNHLLN